MRVTWVRQPRHDRAGESGFVVFVALAVLSVTALILLAVWLAVEGGTSLTQHDLDAKRAYAAATAGVNQYLYELDQNPTYWETCSNDSSGPVPVPGATGGEQYSYAAVPANGNTTCTSDPIASLIDTNTGSLRIEFTGYAGNPTVKRAVVASFRVKSPFDFAWYTVYEALDASLSGNSSCGQFYRTGNRPTACNINWISGDAVNGPMYTQDQYLVGSGNSPTFGRNGSDVIESAAPGSSPGDICAGNSCGSANILGRAVPDAGIISPPTDNSFLATDAANYGKLFTGTTTIQLNGNQATVWNCASTCPNPPTTFSIAQYPVIYVQNASGCTPQQYSPIGPTPGYGNYPSSRPTGCAGDVYVSGTYTSPLTIAAADNIIITGNVVTTPGGNSAPTGGATLGLVANEFVRVMHGASNSQSGCSNVGSQSSPNLDIDAAILAVQHSFMVDNYNCGAPLGTLTVYGTIAQYFRGAVGTYSGNTVSTGYVKDYTYDDRLRYLLPPYLFDIANAGWEVARETLCTPGGSNPANSC